MKKLFCFGIVFIIVTAAQAQCNKAITWKASKTEYLDASGKVQSTESAPVTINTTTNHIRVTATAPDGAQEIIEGDIKNLQCNWGDAFKNGRMSFTSALTKSSGETKNASVTIEAINGKITVLVELANMKGMKMRIPIDDYKQVL